MPKFKVLLSGENLQIEFIEKKWFFWRKICSKKAGFFTTRFVETESANEAIEKVINLVKAELQIDGRFTKDSTIEIVEIHEDEEAFDKYTPGGGFTFFEQN